MSESGRSTSQLLASLQARKDTLEAKLHDKTQELKTLCIKEAELTGFLPPEIPLEPGESPPQFRRRVGTAFTYPENLINNNNVKTKEEETLAALELEYKIQKDIADAALGMANDSSLSKAVRRKHRQVYQKIQRRLADLETKLHHVQQSLGRSVKPQQFKQRKKPRPPLDNDADNQEQDPILHDEGISLSPIGPLHQELETDNVNHRYHDIGRSRHLHHDGNVQVLQTGMWHSSSFNGLSAPVNQDNKAYLRHAAAAAYHHHHHHRQYPNQHYSTLPTTAELGYMVQRERLDPGCSLPGYWLRFGSLDRGYTRTSHSSSSPCLEAYGVDDISMQVQKMPPLGSNTAYYSAAPPHASVDPGIDVRRQYVAPHSRTSASTSSSTENRPLGGGALLPSQTYPEHSLGVNNQGLTRTQSLGSVETSASVMQSHVSINGDTRSVKDQQRFAPPSDTLIRKQKEKEWYETSLDSTPCSHLPAPVQRSCPPSRRPSGHSLSEMKIMSAVQDVSAHNPKNDVPVADSVPNDHISDVSSDLSRSSSNVSNDHHANYHTLQAKCQEMVSPENFDTVVPFESPKNHMVVQAGKWQPYREVTKPFEMADFYKYSTKFRKHMANSQTGPWSGQPPVHAPHPHSGTVHSSPHHSVNDVYHPPVQNNTVYSQARTSPSSNSPTPQQKGIYQPLQPMTCQPLDPASTAGSSRSRVVGSEPSADGKRAGNGKSLADAFSTEMLEWYQDQSVPRSATLV
ncbi:uncharacterized protein GBIM_16395 [Gryllus bimaculatus]|nr:uncharacterized protein GBIM_16395 [Gryllus bimaculatus]